MERTDAQDLTPEQILWWRCRNLGRLDSFQNRITERSDWTERRW